jgi:hypothetical protein
MTLIAVIGAYHLARCADDALARALGHRTLRVGADPISWLAIHTLGASPERDLSGFGKALHGAPCLAASTTTSEYGIELPRITVITKEILPDWLNQVLAGIYSKIMQYRVNRAIWNVVFKAVPIFNQGPIFYLFKKTLMHGTPFVQKMAATYHRAHQYSPIQGILKAALVTPLVFASALITPTIKIRAPEETFKEPDRLIGRVVLVSEGSHSPLSIGLIGTLRHSFRLPPVLSQPTRMLKGVIQLALVGGIIYGAITFCPAFIAAHQTAIIASALFAMI